MRRFNLNMGSPTEARGRERRRLCSAVVLGIYLGSSLSGCSGSGTGWSSANPGNGGLGASARATRSDIDALVSEYGFCPVLPPRSDVLPGRILESTEPGSVFVGTIPVKADSAVAEFMRSWSVTRSIDAGVLFELLPHQDQVRAELKTQGVASYSFRFSECEIRSTDLLTLERAAQDLPPDAGKCLRQGAPVVLEALVVKSFTVSFSTASRSTASINVPIVRDLVGGDFGITPTSAGEYEMCAASPVVLGIKTRTVLASGGKLLDLTERLAIRNQDSEPNDDRASAGMFDVNATADGSVGFSSDREDWYLIMPQSNGIVTITVTNTTAKGTKAADLDRVMLFMPGKDFKFHGTRIPVGRSNTEQVPMGEGEIYYLRVRAQAAEAARYRVESSFEE